MPPTRSLDRTIVRALGELRRDLLGEALDAGADGDEALGVAAVRAVLRPRLGVAAVVAEQDAAEAVLDEPGRAVRAPEAAAAGAAEGQRGIAAAVEEEQRRASRPASRRPPRPAAATGAPALGLASSACRSRRSRQPRRGVAVGQHDPGVAAGIGVDP